MSKAYRDLIIGESLKDGFFYLGDSMNNSITIKDIDSDEPIIEIAENIGDVLDPFIESNLNTFDLERAEVLGEFEVFNLVSNYITEKGGSFSRQIGSRGRDVINKAKVRAKNLNTAAGSMDKLSNKMSSFANRRFADANRIGTRAKQYHTSGGIRGHWTGMKRGVRAATHGALGLGAKIGAGMIHARKNYLKGAARGTMARGLATAKRVGEFDKIRQDEMMARQRRMNRADAGV